MHIITSDNCNEALEAVRDILMMYTDMADSCGGFSHNVDVYIRFDPLKFIDAVPDDRPYYYGDLELLRAGCAIAILCDFYNCWDMEESAAGNHYLAAIENGKLAAFPDIENLIRDAIRRESEPNFHRWFYPAVVPIYRKYVLGYFARLAASDRSRRHGMNVLALIRRLLPPARSAP